MGSSLRFYAGLVILVALLVVTAVLGGKGGLYSTGPPLPAERVVDRIAYVDLDTQIRSVRPDGSDDREISPEGGIYTWPTWSPDARKLVFSGVVPEGQGGQRISLYASDVATNHTREIYVGEPGVAGLLADGVFHYPLWSPDSEQVAFVVVTSRGLTLFLDDLSESTEAEFVLDQGPLWMSWSSDSTYLMAHRGQEHFLITTQGGVQVSHLGIRSVGYRVPAWKPMDHAVTLAEQSGPSRYTVFEAEVSSDGLDDRRPIIDVRPNAAFLWSPTGDRLAVAGSSRVIFYQGVPLLIYRELTVLPQDKKKQPVTVQDAIIAYFWSPDGTMVAYVALTEPLGVLRWMVWNVEEGVRWPLVDFTPTRDQMTMLEFFDQYAYSHLLWSPDSTRLVFSGRLRFEAVAVSHGTDLRAQEAHIYVVEAEPNPSPQIVADGSLGFWSPR